MRKKVVLRALAALAGGSVLAVTGVAGAAQQTCTTTASAATPNLTVGDANTVFINGSSAVKQLLQHLGYVLYEEGVAEQGDAAAPDLSKIIKIVYQSTASCEGVSEVTAGTSDKSTASYIDGAQASGGAAALDTCTIASQTWNMDIGASDVFPATCGVTVPTGFYDFDQGAIQVMEIAVPNASSEFSITADAAYVVFGYGGDKYTVGPWTQLSDIWIRTAGNSGSGTEAMIGSAIGLAPSLWLSQVAADASGPQEQSGSGGVLTAVQTATDADATIGILSASNVDPNKGPLVLSDAGAAPVGGVRPLAFQAYSQTCGYYPDSTASSFDKINVRQGRYALWGAHHWVTNAQASDGSTPMPIGVNGNSAAVATVIAHLMHASSLAEDVDQAMIKAEAQTHDVPSCAMQVARSAEVSSTAAEGGEMSYQPPKGCGCYFESIATGTTPAGCQTCTGAGDAGSCSSGVCNYGFCEVQ